MIKKEVIDNIIKLYQENILANPHAVVFEKVEIDNKNAYLMLTDQETAVALKQMLTHAVALSKKDEKKG